jgi:hypothetical protein
MTLEGAAGEALEADAERQKGEAEAVRSGG